MKKSILLSLVLVASFFLTSQLTSAQKAYVPDNNFEQALIDYGVDAILDDSVLQSNIDTVTILNVKSKGIRDLTGIKSFKNLYHLDCSFNSIKVLDVSNMNRLRVLFCNTNSMNKLTLTGAISLNDVYCFANNLKVLNVEGLRGLHKLFCSFNQITHLDVRNTGVTFLYCASNKLTSLNITNLYPSGTNVNSSLNPDLMCISVLDPNQAWTSNGWYNKAENAMYATQCSNPVRSYVPDNTLEKILIDQGYDDVMDDSVLFDVVKNIDTLDLSNSPDITNFAGIESFKNLKYLNLSGTKANIINLNGKTDANVYYRTADQISALENLTYLNVSNSKLTQLDLRGLTGLKTGKMISTNNPSLNCILVDDKAAADNNVEWKKDNQANYGTTCKTITGTDDLLENSTNIYPNPSFGVFTVSAIESTELSVKDAFGKVVYSKKIEAGNHIVSLTDAVSGVYFVEYVSRNGVSVQKIMVK